MQHAIDIGEIKSRADRLGVTLKVLANEAGVDQATAYRGASGRDVRVSTARRLSNALIRREREQLRYLLALHPDVPAETLADEATEEAAE